MSVAGDAGEAWDAAHRQRWFPLCAPADLPPRHVLEVELLGQELALWRDSGGLPNVWQNRCPHRGLRLTLGANLGEALRCAYHGYRFGAGSARCTLVPAEPARTPPASLRVATFPALEREGLLWTRLAGGPEPGVDPSPARVPPLPPGPAMATALYPIPVSAPAGRVAAALARYRCRATAALRDAAVATETCVTTPLDAFSVESIATRGAARSVVRLHVRPVDAHCTVIHGVLLGELAAEPRLAALRHHAARLNALRRALESGT